MLGWCDLVMPAWFHQMGVHAPCARRGHLNVVTQLLQVRGSEVARVMYGS